jgi:MFS family permease
MSKISSARGRSAQIAIVTAFFTQGVLTTTQIPRIPELIDQIGVNFSGWGLIIGLSGLGSLLGLTVANRFINRFGAKRVILYGSVISSLMLMTLGLATDPFVFFVLQAAMSFSMSCFNIALNAQSVVLQKALNRTIIGRFHAAWSIGATISAAVSGVLASFMPLWLHLILVPSLAIVAFLLVGRNLLTDAEGEAVESKKDIKRIPFFKSPPQVWLLAAGLFAGVFPELVMMDWSAVFAKTELGLNASLGAIPYAVFTGAMIVGRLLIGPMTKRWHISDLSKWGGILGAVAFGLGVLLGPLLADQDKYLALAVTAGLWAIFGLGLAPMVPSFFSAAGYVKGLSTAQVLARMSLVNSLVIIGAKIAMGALAQGVGLHIAFILPLVLLVVAGVIAGMVAKRSKRSEALANAFPLTGPIGVIEN